MGERWAVFDKYVSSVDSSATEKYVALIKKSYLLSRVMNKEIDLS